ncbi:MAG TPA: hypothetical protein DCY35_09185 [Prolixibacteraceae bacterium]|nr:hypothetical protein [Prolixibacteraceae bacterium]
MNSLCKVLILESFPLFSRGIRLMLEHDKEFDVIGEANGFDDLKFLLSTTNPDLVVMDAYHCEQGGTPILKKAFKWLKKIPVFIIARPDFSVWFQDYLRLGVKGIVLNNASPEELMKAMKKVCSGVEQYPSQYLDGDDEMVPLSSSDLEVIAGKRSLTDREFLILHHISQGMSYKQIGRKLYISPRTVESHKRNILSKLGLKTTTELIKYSMQNNIN